MQLSIWPDLMRTKRLDFTIFGNELENYTLVLSRALSSEDHKANENENIHGFVKYSWKKLRGVVYCYIQLKTKTSNGF